MNDETTYEELMERCGRLANIIVRNNNATEMLLRAEIKKAKAMAWEEGYDAGHGDAFTGITDNNINPYEEES